MIYLFGAALFLLDPENMGVTGSREERRVGIVERDLSVGVVIVEVDNGVLVLGAGVAHAVDVEGVRDIAVR